MMELKRNELKATTTSDCDRLTLLSIKKTHSQTYIELLLTKSNFKNKSHPGLTLQKVKVFWGKKIFFLRQYLKVGAWFKKQNKSAE